MRKTLFASLVLMMSLILALFVACDDDGDEPVGSGTPKANVRVIHTSYDAPDVDVRVDGSVAVSGLAFGATSGYRQLEPGNRNVTVTPSGATTPVVIDVDLNLSANVAYTVLAVDQLDSIDAIFDVDDRSPNPNKARVRFIHASPDAGAVDIKLNSGTGPAVFSNAAFKDITDYTEVDAGPYNFAVTAAGSTAEEVVYNAVGLQNGNVYTIVAYGTLDKTDAAPFTVRVFTDNDDGAAFVDLVSSDMPDANVRVIHASYDAGAVDVLVDDAVAVSSLTYGEAQAYTMVPAGTRNLKVTPAGQTTPVVINTDEQFNSAREYTVVALDELSALDLAVGGDLRTPDPAGAKVRFIHAAPDAPSVDIKLNSGFGPAVFSGASFKDITSYTSVGAGDYQFVITQADSTWEVVAYEPINLMAGQVYTVLALGTLDPGDSYPFTVRVFSDNDEGNTYTDLVVEPRDKSDFRVMHLSPDAPAVDVLVDGNVALPELEFPTSSKYTELNAGTRNIQVTPAGGGATVIDADLTFATGSEYTIFAVDELTAITALFEEDARTPDPTQAKVRFVHAVPDAPAVDVKVGTGSGATVFGNQAFGNVTDYQLVAEDSYRFVVTATGQTDELIVFDPVTLSSNTTYTIVAHGTLDNTDDIDFGVRAFVDNGDGDTFVDLDPSISPVRLIHASYDGPPVNVRSDGELRIENVSYRNTSGYVDFLAGTRNITVSPAGSPGTVVIDDTLLLDEDAYYTAFAFDEVANIEGVFVSDDRTLVSDRARVRFVHAVPDAGPVDIKVTSGTGTSLFSNAAFKDISAYSEIEGGSYILALTAAGDTEEIEVYDPFAFQNNNLYTVVAFGTLDTLDQYPLTVRVFNDGGDGLVSTDLTINEPAIRFIHASHGAPDVDVLVDDAPLFDTVMYAEASGYDEVLKGIRNLKVQSVAGGAPVIDQNLDLAFNTDYTIFAVD
ncbi:DUF4397 domain-containing protein, partial [candidate division GN15 bacterium]|nr:DUF4397 domain-containing protein [candidate division GN15 bacterium]